MLDELGLKYDTDKSSQEHDFLVDYEDYLKDKKINSMLEIGIFKGGSLRMWGEYYPEATIYGIDIDPAYLINEGNIHSYLIDQREAMALEFFVKNKNLDLVIEDGSHMWVDQWNSFLTIFPLLKSGAVYIIEDLHTSFHSFYEGKITPYEIFRMIPVFTLISEMRWIEKNLKTKHGGSRSLILKRR